MIAYLAVQPYASELIVVDDGSGDETPSIIGRLAATHPVLRVLRNDANGGKGAAVKRGMLEARGRFVFFMDADLSVPVSELAGALGALAQDDRAILVGSRRVPGAVIQTHQPRLREWLGFGFTYLAQLLIWREIADFTCGFKGFRRNEARLLFSLQTCNDWAFDAEILYLARLLRRPVHQHPVRWSHQNRSRVRLPRDIYRSLMALIRIRRRVARLIADGGDRWEREISEDERLGT